MTYQNLFIFAAAVIAMFSGCMNPTVTNAVRQLNRDAARTDSPYRYRAYRVPGGAAVEKYRAVAPTPSPIPADLQPTTANAELQKDVLAKIALIEQGWSGTVTPSLAGVQRLPASDGSTKETWLVRQGYGAIRYEVVMTPSAQGGTDFSVKGPLTDDAQH
jgi:hypothetical protein